MTEIEHFWAAGGGKGWPYSQVSAALKEKFNWPDGGPQFYTLPWSGVARDGFFFRDSRPNAKPPTVLTCDPRKWEIATMCGEPAVYLPGIMPPPIDPPPGYREATGHDMRDVN